MKILLIISIDYMITSDIENKIISNQGLRAEGDHRQRP